MPRKILVFDTAAQFTITIPDDAKITFGPSIPFTARQEQGQRNQYAPRDHTYSLRIYKGNKENLLAVFPDVRGFRDESLEIGEVRMEDEQEEQAELSEREAPAPTPRRGRARRPVRRPLDVRESDPPSLGAGVDGGVAGPSVFPAEPLF